MTKTRVDMIVETLRDNPGKRFTARELAEEFLQRYPEELEEKRANPRYATHEQLLAQIAAEIGGTRIAEAKRRAYQITTQDKPRPRKYWWDPSAPPSHQAPPTASTPNQADEVPDVALRRNFSEADLYPLLIEYLHKDLGLYCRRIDERKSRNQHGSKGNHWLHPDIVALEPLNQHWDSVVKTSARFGNDSSIRLWSFEVKRHLTRGNIRESFFQAVSNSTWANYGYLVATSLNQDAESELQMLSSLHGIGILLLDIESLFDSQILIPAQYRQSVDWQSVNRIVEENSDFKGFIEQVGVYSQMGTLTKEVWNR